MPVWDQSVEVLREAIFAYARVCDGSLGAGILLVSVLARLALLPLALRLARAADARQRLMARLEPALADLRKAHAGNRAELAREMTRLFEREGVSPWSAAGCVGPLAQMPVVLALCAAVRQASAIGGRFLWIRNLATPDLTLTVAAAVLTVLTTAGLGGASTNRPWLLIVSAAITVLALSKMAAGVGLYWGVSSAFGATQRWMVARARAQAS